MDEIIKILQEQKEVKYLTYFIMRDRLNVIKLKLGAAGIEKIYKFSDENACLNKLIDILSNLKRLETWNLKRLEKDKKC